MPYIKESTIYDIADGLLREIDAVPLDRPARVRRAIDIASDDYGLTLNLAQALYIVKLADNAWNNVKIKTKMKIAEGE